MRACKILALMALLAACSSVPEAQKLKNQPRPTAKPGHALIYIYREDHLAYDDKDVLIRDGNQSVALLSNASCAYFWLSAGRHTLYSYAWGNLGGGEYTADFQDGRTYYMKIEIKKFDPNLVIMQAAFVPVKADVGEGEISDLRLSDAGK